MFISEHDSDEVLKTSIHLPLQIAKTDIPIVHSWDLIS